MGMVGGDRHYDGGGLGPIPGWGCPSCGAENQGPLAQGCTACGAGRPGRHVGMPPARPPAALAGEPRLEPEPASEGQPELEPGASEAPLLNPFQRWIRDYPAGTVEDAFTAGYVEGVRAARRASLAQQPMQATTFTPDGVVNRTIVAALELFREQVLAADPEEVATGEWLSAHQVNGLIREITGQIRGEQHG